MAKKVTLNFNQLMAALQMLQPSLPRPSAPAPFQWTNPYGSAGNDYYQQPAMDSPQGMQLAGIAQILGKHDKNFGDKLGGWVSGALGYPLGVVESTYRYSPANMLANMLHDKSPAGALKATPAADKNLGATFGNIFDPNKQLHGYDIMAGKPGEKNVQGLLAGEGGTKRGALGFQAPKPVLFGAGLATDIIADPLNLAGGAGIAAHGPEAVANAAAKATSRLATEAAVREAVIAGEGTAKELAVRMARDPELGARLLDKYGAASSVKTIFDEGMRVVAEARRTGVSRLSREEIAKFLTDAEGKQMTRRGLTIRGANQIIPGTDRGPLATAGELWAGMKAKGADTLISGTGKVFQTDKALLKAARSGDPTAAYEAVSNLMYKGAARSAKTAFKGTLAHDAIEKIKDLSETERGLLFPALEGDLAAQARLGSKYEPLQKWFADAREWAVKEGVPVAKTEDYAPHRITEEGRKLLAELGGKKGSTFSPSAWFQRARTLKEGETFFGEVLKGSNADIVKQVNRIAYDKLKAIDPKAAEQMAGFFDPNPDTVLYAYIDALANRVGDARAAQGLYEMGIGSASREVVADPAAQEKLREVAARLAGVEQQAVTLGERTDMTDAARAALERHLAEQRVGQLGQSLSGAPITSPLTDVQQATLAGAAATDAGAAVQQARDTLTALEAKDVARAQYRGAAAENLRGVIADLRSQLDSTDPAVLEHAAMRVQQLAQEGDSWVARRDGILREALAGARSDVVMPSRWRTTLDSAGNAVAVPQGKWAAVEPEVAFRNAGNALTAGQENGRMLYDLTDAVNNIRGAQGNPTMLGESLGKILKAYDPTATDREIEAMVASMTDTAPGGKWMLNKSGDQFVGKLQRVLVAEDRRIKQELDAAAKIAEKHTRNGSNGLINGALFHGSPQGFPEGIPSRITSEGHTLENLDGPGLYTTTDQTGRITVGKPMMAENEMNRGFAFPERAGARSEINPTVYTFAPKDPNAALLPVVGDINPEHLSNELLSALDEFHGGDGWLWWEPSQGGPDPILEFLAHDAAQFAGDPQLADELLQHENFGKMYQALRAHFDETLSTVEDVQMGNVGSLRSRTITTESQAAADAVHGYVDHLYDDLGIKGLSRPGGQINDVANPVDHQHNIWFRPNDDLEMVGKADFSAAFAEKQVRELAKERGHFSDVLRTHEEVKQQLAARTRDLKAYGKNVGKVTASPATRRAEDGVRFAIDQEARAQQYMNDTVDAIKSRRTAHMDELRKLNTYLSSGAPMPAEMRQSLHNVVDDLHQAVLWGHVHEQALTTADNQLRRVAALEQSAAETRAALSDLHFEAVGLQREMADLGSRTIENISEAVRSGLQTEVKRGVGTPREVAELLLQSERFVPPDALKPILKRVDRVVQWQKAWQIGTPGFHIRNTFGSAFQNELYNAVEGGGMAKSNYEWFRAWTRVDRSKGNLLSKVERARYDDVMEVIGRGQTTVEGRGASNFWEGGVRGNDRLAELGAEKKGGTFLPSRRNYWLRGSRKVGEDVEMHFRGALAWDALKRGYSKEEAAALVRKYHFDYQDLTAAEQGIRHVIPFYTWTRKNLPLQIEMLFHRPVVYNRFFITRDNIERQSEGGGIVPPYWKLPIRLPWGGYATPDLPMADLQEWTHRPLTKVLTSVSPVFKSPVEAFAGKQLYEGIPLSDSKYVPIPLPAIAVKGVGPALVALGKAKEKDGHYFVTEKNAYLLGQNVPIIANYRRMLPQEDKYQTRHMSTMLGILLGFGYHTKAERDQYEKSRQLGERFAESRKRTKERNLQRAVNALENRNG